MPTKKAPATRGTRRVPTTTNRAANQRADAQRNRAKILAAAVTAIRKNPDVSVADIAAEAGVGRMTLYGHFQTRAELIEEALVDSLERGEAVLENVSLDGEAAQAFRQLIGSSWTLVDQSGALLAAAQKELPATRIRELHEKAETRMRELLLRGQREGVFRIDLPVTWLLTTAHVVMNGAAEEVRAGRLDPDDAPWFIDAILLPSFTANATTNGAP
ncbi:MAG: TetR/AcrR family transcriptional regulator [Rhodococcus sp. (in: high G+C Gram-positive bacteria)]|uniref:Transcriptional regulator, TetR family n=1 Tax=Brevibacterium antiquum CNRZ 918 TaxID=1255637 RepID=A0A2H1KZU8_9MICO|nr:TetR/AcrR family transcriptional regulator [Brevibacterium antiquum]MDN5545015.1 TetR/AcrR family transcriptional regulator [Rhodococcus sp. (in: high G+C Gram-positive bacteria)]SMY05257.1 transcriptional regulator, TetR family [Brevibacterium antiquum CNRZ 918]